MNKRFEVVEPIKNQIAFEKDKWLDRVEISLSHTTGGISYYNYERYPAGWYLHFTPVHIEKHDDYEAKSTIMFHDKSYKILCNDAGRFTAKRFELLKNQLMIHKEKLAQLYDEDERQKLFDCIKSIFYGVK